MTATVLGIMTDGRQHLPLARGLREALVLYARRTWPTNTAKQCARAWGLDITTAANLIKGHASDATLTRVFRAGGWAVASAVVTAVIGEQYETFIEREIEEIALERRRVEETERLARARWARVLARNAMDGGGLRLVAQEDRAWPEQDRSGSGELGAQAPRRLKAAPGKGSDR